MPNDSFALQLLAAGAGACTELLTPGPRGFVPFLCGHVMAGSWGVSKASVDLPDPQDHLYMAATASLLARVRIVGPLHAEAALDGQLPFTRPTWITTTCPATGFEPAFAALALSLGIGVSR
jgi:hypothetical protein